MSEDGVLYERKVGMEDAPGTMLEVSVLGEPGEEPSLHLSLLCGFSGGRAMPSIEAARRGAAAILDACDVADPGSSIDGETRRLT